MRAASVEEVRAKGALMTHLNGHTIALFSHEDRIFAIDNRCPHMGFPLHRGSVHDCVLTCHWHHARFDLNSGGTFDLWADDLRPFPVDLRNGDVWVDVSPIQDIAAHQRTRLRDGLERDLSLVVGKAAIQLLDLGEDPAEPFRIGLDFGTNYRSAGWGPGLTILTCMMNLIPHLDAEERSRALYHGLSAVGRDTIGASPRFAVRPLPGSEAGIHTLKRWFRHFVEVRDADGAERCIVTALRAGADHRQMADMLFAAATDHRYIQIGHVLDFTNKALEAVDLAGWSYAENALASLANGYASASRMEESNSWRHPIDLVSLLEDAFEKVPGALREGAAAGAEWNGRDALVPVLLGEDAAAIVESLLDALRLGASPERLGGTVCYTAALRIARFHTSNEFADWDRALHTFTFSNAVHQGLRRLASTELLRGVFDAAISIYLDRFLNIPPARLPEPARSSQSPAALLQELERLTDRQQQVNEAGTLVAQYFANGGEPRRILATLGRLLLREDRDFHTIQTMEAAVRQHTLLAGEPAGVHALVAAARYLAAHSPTVRSQGQTYTIARRLTRGDRLFEEE
jgi:nitrite reductase/ring-hydroxylating ferredoxin subunit